MREIKFRAWVVDEYEEDGNTPATYKMLQWFPEFFSDMSPVTHWGSEIGEDVILMQYTGLKDKNGVEIYEGDIVENCNGIHMERAQVVEYDGGGFYPFAIPGWEGSADVDGVEVIGNIYENPELLK